MEERAVYRFRRDPDGVYRAYLANRDRQDGVESADFDEPFDGFKPADFGTRQMARLLVLRGRVIEGKLGKGALSDDLYDDD